MQDSNRNDYSCELAQEQILLLTCSELPAAEQLRLRHHLAVCASCAAEYEEAERVCELLGADPALEPSASLLAASRIQLDLALDREFRSAGFAQRIRAAVRSWSVQLQAAPVMAALLLLVGFGGGGIAGVNLAEHNRSTAPPSDISPAAMPSHAGDTTDPIANVSSIETQPGSNIVQVHYNRLVPAELEADSSDPRVQQLLLLASQGSRDSSARENSVSLLASQCKAASHCDSRSVRQALMSSLRYDKNPAVRRKALDGLARYVGEDEAVRNQVLETLLHDDDAALRSRAIQMLAPVEADGSVRQALHTVATQDSNPYLRTVSRETLEQAPEIQ